MGALEACIHEAAQALLKEVALFDIYQGENLPAGKKSVAFNLVLRADDRSLTAQEADDEVKLILEQLGTPWGNIAVKLFRKNHTIPLYFPLKRSMMYRESYFRVGRDVPVEAEFTRKFQVVQDRNEE